MAKKKNQDAPTLDIVRAVAEKIARDRGCNITEVTGEEIRAITGGSDGYVGAHLQTIKLEHIRADRFDVKQLPVALRSALSESHQAFQQRGEETGRAEGKITQDLFDQICKKNSELEAEVARLEQQLATTELERKTEKLDYDNNLMSIKVEKQSLANHLASAQQSLADASKQLKDLNYELGHTTSQVKGLEDSNSQKDQIIHSLNQQLNERTVMHETISKEASDQKQRADLLSLHNHDLVSVKELLERRVEEATSRAAKAEAELTVYKNSHLPSGKK